MMKHLERIAAVAVQPECSCHGYIESGWSANQALPGCCSSPQSAIIYSVLPRGRGSRTGYGSGHSTLPRCESAWSRGSRPRSRTPVPHAAIHGRSGHRPGYHGRMSLAQFVLRYLPPPPARVLEIGCGPVGDLTYAIAAAGYETAAVDPVAPEGPLFRRIPFE